MSGESGAPWCPECGPDCPLHGEAHVYAVRYPDSLVRDSSWRCVADVIASFHGGYYTSERGQVTGTLVRAVVGTDVWVEV